jgi:GAF domain-containing protein
VQRLDGDEVVRLASTSPERLLRRYAVAGTVAERVLAEARTIHVHSSPEEQLARYPESPGPQLGVGAQLSTPLLRGGEAVGVLGLARYDPRPFSDTEIELLETFANQAVIAIENARLFGELADLNRTLEARVSEQVEELERGGDDQERGRRDELTVARQRVSGQLVEDVPLGLDQHVRRDDGPRGIR